MNNTIINKRKLIIFIMIISLLSLSGCSIKNSKDLKVHFLDVGQADSTLIELPNSETALIDGGNRGDSEFIVNYIRNLDIKKIDYIIATHPHADHIGGLAKVIEAFDIGKVYMPGKTANTKVFEDLLIEIKKKDLKIIQAKNDMTILRRDDLELSILSPISDKYKKVNDYSIVNKLRYKNISLLFTGDSEVTSENELINSDIDLSVDILKVGHHGSNTSSTDEFLGELKPRYAVISCGTDNKYGHPDPLVLERFNKRDIKVLSTDKMGTIILDSNGKDASFKTEY